MRLVDLSQTIAPDMPLFSPEAPQPAVGAWLSHQQAAASGHYQGCTCEISEVHLLTSIGTYLDSPYHFHPNGSSIEKLPLEGLVLPGVVVDCTHVGARGAIGPEVLEGMAVAGKAVLFHPGWSRYWGAPEYHDSPFLTGEAARALLDSGVRLAGVDFLVIDDTRDPRRPVHVTLLGAGVLIVENLTNLAALPEAGFTFHAVPAKVAGAAAFPVRAYAVIPENQT
jgi:kynurenine formamidase